MSGNYGVRLAPRPMTGTESVTQLVDDYLLAYNGARLREACQLFARKILQPDVVVGVTLSGALTPTGLGVGVRTANELAAMLDDELLATDDGAPMDEESVLRTVRRFQAQETLRVGLHDVDLPKERYPKLRDLFGIPQAAAPAPG